MNHAVPHLLSLGILLALGLGAGARQAATAAEVFRCTARDGSIEYRQGPCDGSTQEQALTLEDRPKGWVAPKGDTEPRQPPPKPRQAATRHTGVDKTAQAQERRCWEKRQRLEEVEDRLRQGYKAKEARPLKGKRDSYAAYLEEFCD